MDNPRSVVPAEVYIMIGLVLVRIGHGAMAKEIPQLWKRVKPPSNYRNDVTIRGSFGGKQGN